MTDSSPKWHKQKGNGLGHLLEKSWGWALQALLDRESHVSHWFLASLIFLFHFPMTWHDFIMTPRHAFLLGKEEGRILKPPGSVLGGKLLIANHSKHGPDFC